jgi:hypothetical protein
MSFRARQTEETVYRDARYNRRMRRMEVMETTEDGTPLAVVCRDRTRRRIGTTGKEGALSAACDQVRVSLVPVLVPKVDKRLDPHTRVYRDEALELIDCILAGVTVGDKSEIGFFEARRRYAYRDVDVCERTKQIRPT